MNILIQITLLYDLILFDPLVSTGMLWCLRERQVLIPDLDDFLSRLARPATSKNNNSYNNNDEVDKNNNNNNNNNNSGTETRDSIRIPVSTETAMA
ncbi:hypothetical protein PoB_000976500 [Plakobranchus ocellatus]|uniref:Uncharacterized protein n=1 Tax=Plakobranchus ocellatus TaxID=259542 RepID=A0AAV3YL69_9GAST|nr:hypothetical protein PoB_000976500 [Plakobranchus ocellatus]